MRSEYSGQELAMMMRGMELLIEREQSLMRMVDAAGKRQIRYFIGHYKKIIRKLEDEE